MERKLFISVEALQNKGKEYFRNLDASDYCQAPYGSYMLDDGLLISIDDMNDVYVQLTEDDEAFTDVEDLFND